MKPEGLIESIRQRLLNLSRENGETFDFVLARYGVERFLYRLSVSEHADHFVLKGSMLFHVWNHKMHRPTRDLDLLSSGAADQESIRKAILDVLRTDVADDGLSFDEISLAQASDKKLGLDPVRHSSSDIHPNPPSPARPYPEPVDQTDLSYRLYSPIFKSLGIPR